MKEFKGSPGKWKAVPLKPIQGYCTHEIQFNNDGECVTDGVYGEANAKLIAASKDLLEALQEMNDVFYIVAGSDEVRMEEAKEAAKEAINKALN